MRHALITAGSKGLGKKVSEKLLEKGYSITVNYRSDYEAVKALKQQWSADLSRVQFVQGDITKKADIQRIVDEAYQKFGRLDVLVNNAGPYIFNRKKLVDYDEDEWYEMMEGNLSSVFHFVKKVVPIMRDQKYGRIITYGFQGANTAPAWIHRSAYGAAKVGLVSLMKTLSVEEAEHGITVNMVCPGNIVGEMKEASIAESKQLTDEQTPIGRPGTGEDVARTISFLCADESDMITGAVVEVTGGVDVLHRFRS